MSATDRKGNSRQEGFLFIAKDPEQLNEQKQKFFEIFKLYLQANIDP